MLEAYYSRKRFAFIHNELMETGLVAWRGESTIRKTGCFYGETFNVYVDTSDGVNEDLPIEEYCGRMRAVIRDSAGKPFLYFKCIYSPERSQRLTTLAAKHGGQVVPFMHWSYNQDWHKHLWPKRKHWQTKKAQQRPHIAIGMGANVTPYRYPRPNASDGSASWQDYELFGIGTGEETGFWSITTRHDLHTQLAQSGLSYDFSQKIPYTHYLKRSFQWQVVVCPPGVGEYTQRMFDHGHLGQCMLFRKTSYDFGISWKNHIPEVDFTAVDWEQQLLTVIDTYQDWEERTQEYFEKYMTPSAIAEYFVQQIEIFTSAPHSVDAHLEMGDSQSSVI